MDAPSDSELVESLRLVSEAQSGAAGALDELLARYLPYIRQIVALRLGWGLRRVFEVEDIVQQVVIRLLQGIDRLEVRSEGEFRNWLSKCAQNEIVDLARAHGSKKRSDGREQCFTDTESSFLSSILVGEEPSPSEHARAKELAETLETTLLAMPEHHRELIVLRSICGMSFEEIAMVLGFSKVETVRVAFSRALKKLKKGAGIE